MISSCGVYLVEKHRMPAHMHTQFIGKCQCQCRCKSQLSCKFMCWTFQNTKNLHLYMPFSLPPLYLHCCSDAVETNGGRLCWWCPRSRQTKSRPPSSILWCAVVVGPPKACSEEHPCAVGVHLDPRVCYHGQGVMRTER